MFNVCVRSLTRLGPNISKAAGDTDSVTMEHLQEMARGESMTSRDPLQTGGVEVSDYFSIGFKC